MGGWYALGGDLGWEMGCKGFEGVGVFEMLEGVEEDSGEGVVGLIYSKVPGKP